MSLTKSIRESSRSGPGAWFSVLMWFIVVLMLALLAWVLSQRVETVLSSAEGDGYDEAALNLPPGAESQAEVPEFRQDGQLAWFPGRSTAHTVIPERKRDSISSYTVEARRFGFHHRQAVRHQARNRFMGKRRSSSGQPERVVHSGRIKDSCRRWRDL